MTHQLFEDAIHELCRLGEIEDAPAVLQGGPFLLDGHEVRIEYIELPALCRIVIDLGISIDQIDEATRIALLESNFILSDETIPVTSVNPDTGRVMLTFHIPLSAIGDRLDLHEILTEQITVVVDHWTSELSGSAATLDALPNASPPFPVV